MCGLAGYNCSLERAEEFADNRAARIATVGWRYNLSRGIDAHGYMATYAPELPHPDGNGKGELWTYKTYGSAEKSIKHRRLPRGKPVSLALHTRDYTHGDPKDNDNNHPIHWGSVYVTHNGGISNHVSLKSRYRGKVDSKHVPTVDSVVLPMMLDQIADPFDEVEVKSMLDTIGKEVFGAYTFHAMWVEHPGLSLITLGKDRPLTFAYHPQLETYLYSSEKEALAVMLDRFAIARDDKDLIHGDLNTGKAVMLYYGVPLYYHTFQPHETTGGVSLFRINKDGEKLADNKAANHWTKNPNPLSLREITTTEWEHDVHNVKDIKSMPKWWQDSSSATVELMKRVASGFDTMDMFNPPRNNQSFRNGLLYFGTIGNKEFVFDDTGKFLDMYDWDELGDLGTPWVEAERSRTSLDELEFDAWLVGSSSDFTMPKGFVKAKAPQTPKAPVVHTPKSYGRTTGGTSKKKDADKKKDNDKKESQKSGQSNVAFLSPGESPSSLSDMDVLTFDLLSSADNRRSLIANHHNKGFVFVGDPRCGDHGGQFFSAHTEPHNCYNTFTLAKMVLCSIRTLDEMYAMYDNIDMVQEGSSNHNGVHDWTPLHHEVVLFSEKEYSWVPVEEVCGRPGCTRRRKLLTVPDVAEWAILEADEYMEGLKEMTTTV